MTTTPTTTYGKAIINDELTVEWVRLGEGLSGDFDPDDPDDVELLRLDVNVSAAAAERHNVVGEDADDGWIFPDRGSVCTGVPATTDPAHTRQLAARAALVLHTAMTGGRPLRHVVERLSWLTGEVDTDDRIFEQFGPVPA